MVPNVPDMFIMSSTISPWVVVSGRMIAPGVMGNDSFSPGAFPYGVGAWALLEEFGWEFGCGGWECGCCGCG